MRKMRLLLLTMSLILGFTGTAVFARYLPEPQPEEVSQMAWWGGVYPEYCLPGAVKLVGAEEEKNCRDEKLPVKIHFKYLTFLND